MSNEANTRAGRLDQVRAAVRDWKGGAISAPQAMARIARVVDVALVAPDDEPESRDLFYIQNVKVVGNCVLWWRQSGHGYTVNLDEAWLVTKKQADEICRSRPKEDIPRPAADVRALAKRHVDVQGFR